MVWKQAITSAPHSRIACEGKEGATTTDRDAKSSTVSVSAPLGGTSRPRYSSNANCMIRNSSLARSMPTLRIVMFIALRLRLSIAIAQPRPKAGAKRGL
jgi:hypothetical protein